MTDKFNTKKRKQVKEAEKCSRSNLKSGSTNSSGEKLQRSAGPAIQIHLLRSQMTHTGRPSLVTSSIAEEENES